MRNEFHLLIAKMRKNSTGKFVIVPPASTILRAKLTYEIEVLQPENTTLPLTPALTMMRDACQRASVHVREQEGVVALQIPFVFYERHFDVFIADFPCDINGCRWRSLMVNLQLLDLNKLTEENYYDVLSNVMFPRHSEEAALYVLGGGLNVNTVENTLDYDLEILHGENFFDLDKVFGLQSGDNWARHLYLTFLRVSGSVMSHIWLYPEFVRSEIAPGYRPPDGDEIPF
jgi:hypothetical protein